MKIARLHVVVGKEAKDKTDFFGAYTDVIVELSDRKKFIASFFTYKSMEQLKLRHQQTGDFLHGKYFWANNMVLVENCSKENVMGVVQDLIEEGQFKQIFQAL